MPLFHDSRDRNGKNYCKAFLKISLYWYSIASFLNLICLPWRRTSGEQYFVLQSSLNLNVLIDLSKFESQFPLQWIHNNTEISIKLFLIEAKELERVFMVF
jgi:hypothetical protein